MPHHEKDDKLHLHNALDTTLQLKKDKEKLESAVADRDLQSTMRILQLTLAGEPIYKLADYQMKKENGGAFTFPAFYTYPRGYHIALRVDANGLNTGAGTHVSVYASRVAGRYDADLKWPCLDHVTFTLLNQLEDKNHHTIQVTLVPQNNGRVGLSKGVNQFISQSALGHNPAKNMQYLKHDTLYFKMSFKPAK